MSAAITPILPFKHTLIGSLDPSLPDELISMIYEYSVPDKDGITELFLKILFVDHFNDHFERDPLLDQLKFINHDIEEIDLSQTDMSFYFPREVVKVSSDYYDELFGNAIRNHFPNIKKISLPILFSHGKTFNLNAEKMFEVASRRFEVIACANDPFQLPTSYDCAVTHSFNLHGVITIQKLEKKKDAKRKQRTTILDVKIATAGNHLKGKCEIKLDFPLCDYQAIYWK